MRSNVGRWYLAGGAAEEFDELEELAAAVLRVNW